MIVVVSQDSGAKSEIECGRKREEPRRRIEESKQSRKRKESEGPYERAQVPSVREQSVTL